MADPTADAIKATGLLSSLEKASEAQTFISLFTFMLVIDCGLIHWRGEGIAALMRDESVLKPQLAVFVVVMFVGFSLLMSMARPIVGGYILIVTVQVAFAVRGFLRGAFEALPFRRQDEDAASTRAYRENLGAGFVTISKLEAKAYGSMDKNYLDLLKEAKAERKASEERERQLTLATTTLLVVVGYNWLNFSEQPSPSFLRQAAQVIGEGGTLCVWLFLFAVYWAFVIKPIFADLLDWTYCPPLAREAAADFDRRQEEKRRFREQVFDRQERPAEPGAVPKPRPLGDDLD